LPKWFIKEAAKAKYIKACDSGKKLLLLQEECSYGASRNDIDSIQRHLEDVKAALRDAVSRVEEAGVNDLPLLKSILPYASQFLGNELQFNDFLGSDAKVTPVEVYQHELDSELRREVWFDFLPNKEGTAYCCCNVYDIFLRHTFIFQWFLIDSVKLYICEP